MAVAGVVALSACFIGPDCDFDPCPPGKGSVAALDAQGSERWRTTLTDRSTEPPLVRGDYVLVDGCRAVHVLDAATGRLLLSTEEISDTVGVAGGFVWGADAPDDGKAGQGVRGEPLDGRGGRSIHHAGGGPGESGDFRRTFVVSRDRLVGTHGDVLSVYPAAGGPDRSVQLPIRPTERLVVVEDRVAVAAASDGSVVGVDLATMRLAWRVVPQQVSRRFDLRLEARGETVLVSAVGDSLAGDSGSAPRRTQEVFAVSASDGTVFWRHLSTELADADDTVAVLVSPTSVVGVDVATGRQQWSLRAQPGHTGGLADLGLTTDPTAPVVAGSTVALPGVSLQGQPVVVGVDARTGRELWRRDGPVQPVGLTDTFGASAWDESRAADSHAWLAALDPRTGEQLWKQQLTAERVTEPHPRAHLAGDPARSQTILLDLPQVPQGGCY